MIGMTGTSGKTTINWMLYHLLSRLELPCIRIGSLGIEAWGAFSEEFTLGTPEPASLHRTLARAVEAGMKSCVIEVTSQGLDQARADDLDFDCALFSNLSREHLDYHADMEAYFQAKLRLLRLLEGSPKARRAAVINIDDHFGRRIPAGLDAGRVRLIGVGGGAGADVRIVAFSQSIRGSTLELTYQGRQYGVASGYIGRFNACNFAMAFAAAVSLGLDPARVAELLPGLPQVPGRLQRVPASDIGVFVDYAHKPDALEKVLAALKEVGQGKLWVVFGCGGDRDRGKRPLMAEIAAPI